MIGSSRGCFENGMIYIFKDEFKYVMEIVGQEDGRAGKKTTDFTLDSGAVRGLPTYCFNKSLIMRRISKWEIGLEQHA